MLGIGVALPVPPRLIEEFEGGDVSRASYIYGLLAAAYSLVQFLLAPLLGALSDRFGRRPVILLALVGMGINYMLLAFAPTLALFAVGRMIAAAFGATFTAAGAYLADITPPEKRAQSFGLIGAAFGFGFITGPALADSLFAYFALPESLSPENRKALDWRRANPVGAVRAIGRYGSVLGLIVIFLLAAFANRVAEMTWVLFTSYRFGWGPTETGLSLAMVGVMFRGGAGRARARDRAAHRRAARDSARPRGQRRHVCALRRRATGVDGLSGYGARDLRLDDRAAGRAGDHVAVGARERAGATPGRAREHAESHVDRRAAGLDGLVRVLPVGRGARDHPGRSVLRGRPRVHGGAGARCALVRGSGQGSAGNVKNILFI